MQSIHMRKTVLHCPLMVEFLKCTQNALLLCNNEAGAAAGFVLFYKVKYLKKA